MRKNTILLLLGISITGFARSQQLSPSVIASDGGINKAAGISLEWTLGEPTIESLSTADRLYTQGFHQPVLMVRKLYPGPLATVNPGTAAVANPVTVTESKLTKDYKITIAPNPVKSILLVNIASLKTDKIYLTLIDFAGSQTSVGAFNGRSNTVQVNMSAMQSGAYILELRNSSGQLIQSFKIIKAQ